MSPSSLRIVLGVVLVMGGYFSSAVCGADTTWKLPPYRLGQGLNFPQWGLNVGGYLSIHYTDLEQQNWQFGVRDVSLLVSKNISNRWQFFTEAEIGDATEFSQSGITGDNSEIDLERLYADYRATSAVNVRIGKYLTPVGRWNTIHADPLVWTTDRPLTTGVAFARHATGAMLYGEIPVDGDGLDYSLYADDGDLLDPAQIKEQAFEDDRSGTSPRNAFKRAAGGRIVFHFLDDSASIGASYLRFEMYDFTERKELFGVDGLWTVARMEFSGEWVYRNSLGPSEQDEHGGFMQMVLPLSEHLYLIGRHEKYRAAVLPNTATIDSVGLTYRPHEAISLKLEHRDGKYNQIMAPSGWLGSLAILF
jgi:Phosphate-selective porin O and P